MADPSKDHSLDHLGSYPSSLRRVARALSSLNLNSLRVLLRDGPSAALSFVSHSYHLYSGFGSPHKWQRSPWRKDLRIPIVKLEELFPEMDCTRSLELLFPFPRDLGVLPQELIVLTKVVDHLKAKRVVEFGTAEGRTALNIALHLPPDGEIITLDFPPIPGQNEIGFFYWDQPVKSRIKQIFTGVEAWDCRPYRASAEVVFCDACDRMPGLAAEVYQAFSLIKPGGVIFRHDYASAIGPTRFWEWLARELPVFQIDGTFLLCLRVDSEKVYEITQSLLEHPILKNSVNIAGASQGPGS